MRNCLGVCLLILFEFFAPVYANSHHPQEFLKSIIGAKDEGEQIYKHYCANCHAQKPLISLGAPRIGEQVDWKLRLQQGFDVLFLHTDEGFNAMPPRGGCFECSDRQIALAVVSMIPKEAQKSLLKELEEHKKYRQ
ncbi:c-type cytochrome [uncultured Legionella sp.]|uniref:c-type cytochrome n=1 Tax=uncultured Legionella sp. TaxID=210934 RepID=UPI00260B95E9|nr:c-type cytochrome [uncultured Legionella sp.]